jgi:hypothetical protein
VIEGYMSDDGLERRKLGAFTIAKDETYFLEIWVNYYSRSISKQDMFILDHDSSTAETKALLEKFRADGINIVPIHNDLSYNHYWLCSAVQQFQKFMLHSYEIVLFSEPDEIIIPRPDLYQMTLAEYILDKLDGTDLKQLRCVGYCLEHQPQSEPAIDLSRPIMSQRKTWRYHEHYDKTLISKVACPWFIGFHFISEDYYFPTHDRHLLLIHLHKMDYDLCKAKHKQRVSFKWASDKAGFNADNQNRICDGEEFDHFFSTDKFTNNQVEEIPAFMEGVF